MHKLLTFLFLPFFCLPTLAQGVDEKPIDMKELPSVEESIPATIKKLGPPSIVTFQKGLVTAVSANSELAQTHTIQGLNHLHGGWEVEAARHFAVAMEEDPRCLMAHWGMLMSILTPNPETDSARFAVSERLLQLVIEEEGTELERGYAYSIIKYLSDGPAEAVQAFQRVAEKYPNELQAKIFAALFSRTGYDETGDATPDQENAEKALLQLIADNPENEIPLHAFLLVHAEAPDLAPALDLARALCKIAPDYAPYFYLLGHYEWRSGEHKRAVSAFEHAASLYSNWMKENKISPADCEGWIRAECYRVIALASISDYDNALAAAEKIALTPADSARNSAYGTRELLWNAKTLPARILLRRAQQGDYAKALKSLPTPESIKPFMEHSLAYWWIDGLRITLEAQRLLDAGNLEKARETIDTLSYHGEAMSKKQAVAGVVGERSEWTRSFRSLEVLAAELRGRLALAGPASGRGSAFNWFKAASDRQSTPTMLSAPMILTPMAMKLGDYYLINKEPKKAIEAFEEALAAFPNDVPTLERLQKAYIAAKQPEKAEEIKARLEADNQ